MYKEIRINCSGTCSSGLLCIYSICTSNLVVFAPGIQQMLCVGGVGGCGWVGVGVGGVCVGVWGVCGGGEVAK